MSNVTVNNNNGLLGSAIGTTVNSPASNEITTSKLMDDNNTSNTILSANLTKETALKRVAPDIESNFTGLYHSAGLWSRHEIDYFDQRYRFGILNPYGVITTCREYIFFTKPDLNIYPRDSISGVPSDGLAPYLQSQPYWLDLENKHRSVIRMLQDSLDSRGDHFNHLLENTVSSNLDIPGLSSDMIDTPNNMYGTNYQYRGSSEASNDNFDFSLSFTDTKELSVYHFFRAYEDYQTIKHHGHLPPWDMYMNNKVLYDQFSIYKFLVDEDGETIIYWCKLWGVKPKSLPRDTFTSSDFNDGITYSVDFNAAFFNDMDPSILTSFNILAKKYNGVDTLYDLDIHNSILDRVDNRPARVAFIEKSEKPNSAYGYNTYKLKWKGDAEE